MNLAAGLLLAGAVVAPAQGPNARNMRMYNPATETTLRGTVEAVTQPERGQMMGTHLTIKAGDETREVMLGPSVFISRKGFSFAKGDSIEVTGSRVTMGVMEFVIAREVVKDSKTLTLRDKTGKPEWAERWIGRRRTG
jgi:hypothetical protein